MNDQRTSASDGARTTRHDGFNRRSLLTGAVSTLAAAASAVAHATPAGAAQTPAPTASSGPLVVVTDRGPIAKTACG